MFVYSVYTPPYEYSIMCYDGFETGKGISKRDLESPKNFLKKTLNLNQVIKAIFFITLLILSLSEANISMKKQSGKKSFIKVSSLSSIKIVLVLLTNVIIVYEKNSKVKIEKTCF